MTNGKVQTLMGKEGFRAVVTIMVQRMNDRKAVFMNLTIENLTKNYGKHTALKRVNLELTPGVYALLGPNGAGKSTFMNLITGNLVPDEGEIRFNGRSIRELGKQFRAVLGFMPQQQGLYEHFTAYRFLSYMASLKGMSKKEAEKEIEWALEVVHLTAEAHHKLGTFSGGMKQRILVAQAIMNDPKVLILDEPTAGLDPKERIRIRNIISEIAMGRIVIFATHVVSDIEQIAKEVILLKKGQVIADETPDVLCNQMEGRVFEMELEEEAFAGIEEKLLVRNLMKRNGKLFVRFLAKEEPAEQGAVSVRPDLEDVYLAYFADEEETL